MAVLEVNVVIVIVCFLLVALTSKKLLVVLVRTEFYQKWFAGLLCSIIKGYNKKMDAHKRTLFSMLRDSLEKVDGDILEIGAGPGANFQYYPEGCSIIALDPNKYCKEYFENRNKTFQNVNVKKYILGQAEDMSELTSDSFRGCSLYPYYVFPERSAAIFTRNQTCLETGLYLLFYMIKL